MNYTPFGNDARDMLGRRHVKRWIVDRHFFWSGGSAEAVSNFLRRPFFDWDFISRGKREIKRAGWGRNVKRNVVSLCQSSNAISANLVRGIAVAGECYRLLFTTD